MSLKRTNLCIALDCASADELLAAARTLGPFAAVLSLHADCVPDLTPAHTLALRRVAVEQGFLLMDDRRYADAAVMAQAAAGPCGSARWAHIVTAHAVSGSGVLDGLVEAHAGVHASTAPGHRHQHPFPAADAAEADAEADAEATMDRDASADPTSRRGRISALVRAVTHLPGDGKRAGAFAALVVAQVTAPGSLTDANYVRGAVNLGKAYSGGRGSDHVGIVAGYVASERVTGACVGDGTSEDASASGTCLRECGAMCQPGMLVVAPGVRLETRGERTAEMRARHKAEMDGYTTPREAVMRGADIVVAGHGVTGSRDPVEAAMRLRDEAWSAYEEREGQ
jgi:orotidine-5'-phosphate decarboxylase